MIQEQYVTLETARLLREKGFDEPCFAYYSEYWDDWKTLRFWRKDRRNVQNKGYLNTPTQSLVMKWLMEVHNLHCDIGYDDLDWFWNIISINKSVPVEDRPKLIKNGPAGYKTYEEACETAIKYCLENLID